MYTPPVSSTANEFPIGSWVSSALTAPLPGSIVPTIPLRETNQMRPAQSGMVANSLSLEGTTPETS